MALSPMKCNEFIEYILHLHGHPTTVIICSSREAFLENLQSSLNAVNSDDPPTVTGEMQDMVHPLFIPTIHQLAASKSVVMVFASSLPHLRAYLASYSTAIRDSLYESALVKPRLDDPILAIYGLINLHRSTTEYSVQGLSRSLANAAEAAEIGGMRLLLVENSADSVPEAASETPKDPWTEQVPLLNSSIILSQDRGWAGRMVDIRSVLAKWCEVKSNVRGES
ncbi:MAG: hypothetical protein Q9224_001951 [Gallowayella concinna]